MQAEILLLYLEIDWNYHNSGPEKVRTANSKIFLAGSDLSQYISGSFCIVFDIFFIKVFCNHSW